MKPRVIPLPKTGDADKFEVVFPDPRGGTWREIVCVGGLEQALVGRANACFRAITNVIHNVDRWMGEQRRNRA